MNFDVLVQHLKAAKADRRRRQPCTCEVDHSITKLGHSTSCVHYASYDSPPFPTAVRYGCHADHIDGSPHNFDWATWCEDTMCTGVCSCGLYAIYHSMLEGP